LAKTGASLASTLGAKPGNAITDAPRSAKIPKAANDLIILKLLTWFVSYPSTFGDQCNNSHNEKWFHHRNQWFDSYGAAWGGSQRSLIGLDRSQNLQKIAIPVGSLTRKWG
jgi:hypothetical protein